MKVITKEIKNYLELHEIKCAVDSIEKRTLPVIFLNGSYEGIAETDVKTIKTQFNLSDKENELNFMILPATFTFFDDGFEHGQLNWKHTPENDFLCEYTNRLRIISTLPEEILKLVKDKRLLAMGYAEQKVKKAIIKYTAEKSKAAVDVVENSNEESLLAESGLTIENQFNKKPYEYIYSLQELFDESTITRVLKAVDDLYIELDGDYLIILTDFETLEEEIDPVNTCVEFYELYKNENNYELHFLLMTRDSNMVESFHYVTYAFKDMRLK